MRKLLLVLLLSSVTLAGCGQKGPLVPPSTVQPVAQHSSFAP